MRLTTSGLVLWFFLLQTTAAAPQEATLQTEQPSKTGDAIVDFVSRVLGDTEDVWDRVFREGGRTYEKPRLVLFSRATHTGCGLGESVTGPFYCPRDRKIYLDLSFFRELRENYNATGDFAQAYVVAHEVGHHIQNLLGIDAKVQALQTQAQRRGDETTANLLSVRIELQADCLAGIWAYRTNQKSARLEPGDIESGLNAAAQIADDTIQKRTQGIAVPETFSHGSAEQRMRWFRNGLESGQLSACNTFSSETP
jgi:predicted metalloprotease